MNKGNDYFHKFLWYVKTNSYENIIIHNKLTFINLPREPYAKLSVFL